MTTIKIYKKNCIIMGFEISGHSGYAKAGHDIVCAAISAISTNACLGIKKVLKIDAKMKMDDNTGYLLLMLPKNLESDKQEKAQVLLQTMEQSLEEIAFNYEKFVKMEVQDEIY